ncbi:hypothetical protein BYT27DRAFT_7281205 [Phlegmacium glaucopus]|nr:hypothetical protein BYT27DRAFT_7281205 [Phlegmacium glaucopus]
MLLNVTLLAYQRFMVPALHQMFDGYWKKRIWRCLGLQEVALICFFRVHDFNGSGFGIIGEGKIMAPAIPGSSDWECLSAHAEVLALQEQLGISYKDASHHLYMAELERLKSDKKMHKAFANLQVLTEQVLERAYNSIRQAETRDTSPDMAGAVDGDVVNWHSPPYQHWNIIGTDIAPHPQYITPAFTLLSALEAGER